MQLRCLCLLQRSTEARWMNSRAPETFICIDISHASQEALIKQQGLNSCAAGSRLFNKLFNANFERVGAKLAQLFCERTCRQIGQTPEAPRIGVAQLASIVE